MSFLNLKKKKDKEITSKKEVASSVVSPKKTEGKSFLSDILIKVSPSEKSFSLGKTNQYVFIVRPDANKSIVKSAVRDRYGVKVLTVNMVNRRGKLKRLGRTISRRSDFKKAIVTVASGQKIEIT